MSKDTSRSVRKKCKEFVENTLKDPDFLYGSFFIEFDKISSYKKRSSESYTSGTKRVMGYSPGSYYDKPVYSSYTTYIDARFKLSDIIKSKAVVDLIGELVKNDLRATYDQLKSNVNLNKLETVQEYTTFIEENKIDPTNISTLVTKPKEDCIQNFYKKTYLGSQKENITESIKALTARKHILQYFDIEVLTSDQIDSYKKQLREHIHGSFSDKGLMDNSTKNALSKVSVKEITLKDDFSKINEAQVSAVSSLGMDETEANATATKKKDDLVDEAADSLSKQLFEKLDLQEIS